MRLIVARQLLSELRMSDISIRKTGHAGRITLTRPQALNAMTYDMAIAIETALDNWAEDDAVKLVIIDARRRQSLLRGRRYRRNFMTPARAGDFAYGQRFWRDEYRLNAKIAEYPKPVCRLHAGLHHGRRRRHFLPRLAPDRRRKQPDRHA